MAKMVAFAHCVTKDIACYQPPSGNTGHGFARHCQRSAWPAVAISSGQALAETVTVNWQMPDYPPVIITSGLNKGSGYADVFLRYFIERTPE
jgi:hypothetical protein